MAIGGPCRYLRVAGTQAGRGRAGWSLCPGKRESQKEGTQATSYRVALWTGAALLLCGEEWGRGHWGGGREGGWGLRRLGCQVQCPSASASLPSPGEAKPTLCAVRPLLMCSIDRKAGPASHVGSRRLQGVRGTPLHCSPSPKIAAAQPSPSACLGRMSWTGSQALLHLQVSPTPALALVEVGFTCHAGKVAQGAQQEAHAHTHTHRDPFPSSI